MPKKLTCNYDKYVKYNELKLDKFHIQLGGTIIKKNTLLC